MQNRRLPSLQGLLVGTAIVAAIFAYWPGLHGPFVFDDGANLEVLNDWLTGRVTWLQVVLGNDSGPLGRPLSMASFVATAAIFGADPFGFKLVNLALHCFTGMLVYVLFRQLLGVGGLVSGNVPGNRWIAGAAASVWLLHPLLASTVLYVVQRMAILSALFVVASLSGYLAGRQALEAGHARKGWTLLLIVVPLMVTFAVLSKENGILALPMCALLEWLALRPPSDHRGRLAARIFVATMLVLPGVLAAIALALAFAGYPILEKSYAARPFTLQERLLTETRVLWDYVGSLLVPRGSGMGYYHDDFTLSRGLLDPPATTVAVAGWIVACGAAVWIRKRIPGIAIGLGLFVIGHALESTLFPLALYFEHRNYLPSIGIVWAVAAAFTALAASVETQVSHGRAMIVFGMSALLLVLAAGTTNRAHAWRSQADIVSEGLLMHPDSRAARFEAILVALEKHPPDLESARRHADVLRHATEPSSRLLGAITRLTADCAAEASIERRAFNEVFDAQQVPLEEDLVHALELLSDRIGANACPGITAGQAAKGLSSLLDRWNPSDATNAGWRLRFRAANLYMAADESPQAIVQARLAYGRGRVPTNTAIMIARVLIALGETEASSRILDDVDERVRPDENVAHELIADSRARIRLLQAARAGRDDVQ